MPRETNAVLRLAAVATLVLIAQAPFPLAHAQEKNEGGARAAETAVEPVGAGDIAESLEGVWVAVQCTSDGKELTQPVLPRIAFEQNRVSITEGERTLQGQYTVDASTDPRQVVLTSATERAVLKIAFGLRNGRLTLCFDPKPGAPAPTRLESKEGDAWVRVVLAPILTRRLKGHTGPVASAIFSPDGKTVVTGSGWPVGDRTVRVWDVDSGDQLRCLDIDSQLADAGEHGPNEASGEVRSLAISRDGRHALVGGAGGFVQLWDITDGEFVRDLKGCENTVHAVALTPDGRLALAAGRDKKVLIWDLATGEVLRELKGHGWFVRSLAVSPDGRQALSGSFDRKTILWDLATGEQLRSFEQDGWVFDLAFSPDGRLGLAAVDTDDAEFPVAPMYVWDLETGEQVHRIPAHRHGMTGCAFAPDGRRILSCGYDNSVRLWDAATGEELTRFTGHQNWVWSVAFSPDGRWALSAGGGGARDGEVTAGEDFAVRIWDLELATGDRAKE